MPATTSSTTRHSQYASESASSGTPPSPRSTLSPSNFWPCGEANRSATIPWSSSRMFTPNMRLPWIACCVLPRVFRHTSSIGGSSDRDDTALAVAPKSSSPFRVVSTVTPLAK